MAAAEEAWGQLVSTTEMESEPAKIKKCSFTIGRSPASDLPFNGNKLISGTHCIIQRDSNGNTWLEDKSTNGTLLNMRIKVNKQRVKLQHGDEIHIVYRKNNPETNIAYVFQDTEILKQETSESTLDYEPSETDVATSEPDPPQDEGRVTRSRDREDSPGPDIKAPSANSDRKRKRIDSVDPNPSKKVCVSEKSAGDLSAPSPVPDTPAEEKGDGDKPGGSSDTAPVKPAEPVAKKDDTMDEIEESLICIICQEIFYNCISLQPCMHSFCAGCYSDWMPQSNECPSCRSKVVRINKNHLVNNLVEAFLKAHPGKQRPAEDLAEQDSKNKISKDMLYPKEQLKRASDEDFSSASDRDEDAERSASDSNDDEDAERSASPVSSSSSSSDHNYKVFTSKLGAPGPAFTGFGTNTGFWGVPGKVVCRQCGEYNGTLPSGREAACKALNLKVSKQPGTSAGTDAASGPTPGTSGTTDVPESKPDVKVMPTVPAYRCKQNQTHSLCQCCLEPFPDRLDEAVAAPGTIPPTTCSLCYRRFCHAYWGCYKGCQGCLGVFRDMNFGRPCLRHIIMDNLYESAVLEAHLTEKKLSVCDLLTLCVRRMEGGAYFTQDQRVGTAQFTADTVVCYACGLRNLKELAYQYMRDIPKKELPVGVTSRPDCHWGKNCRTQRNKPNHAARFNHVCEQTKT